MSDGKPDFKGDCAPGTFERRGGRVRMINLHNLRKYGEAPFRVAVIHGGPGAPGEMAPVARELSGVCGVLEPFQTATTVAGQVEELKAVLEREASLPVTLVGHSWGAWLSFITAARPPFTCAEAYPGCQRS